VSVTIAQFSLQLSSIHANSRLSARSMSAMFEEIRMIVCSFCTRQIFSTL